jgi:hypothetical protein
MESRTGDYMVSVIESILSLGMQHLENKEKKEQLAFNTIEAMLQSKTYVFVDALVKLAYAGEAITKSLIRPAFSCGLFIYGLLNPEQLVKLHELGTVGDMGIATIFGAAPAWGYSRHVEKGKIPTKEDKGILDYEG